MRARHQCRERRGRQRIEEGLICSGSRRPRLRRMRVRRSSPGRKQPKRLPNDSAAPGSCARPCAGGQPQATGPTGQGARQLDKPCIQPLLSGGPQGGGTAGAGPAWQRSRMPAPWSAGLPCAGGRSQSGGCLALIRASMPRTNPSARRTGRLPGAPMSLPAARASASPQASTIAGTGFQLRQNAGGRQQPESAFVMGGARRGPHFRCYQTAMASDPQDPGRAGSQGL